MDANLSKDLKGLIKKITVLRKNKNTEAMNLLLHCEKYALFVMHKRNWEAQSVNEFFPKNAALQGLNINSQKIMIRLRPPEDENSFYPIEHIMGTLLHELTHMQIKPHNSQFYKLLDELWEEVEAKGFGSGKAPPQFSVPFSGEGHRLGGYRPVKAFQSNLCGKCDKDTLKSAVRKAALQRLERNSVTAVSVNQKSASGGYILGGSTEKYISRSELAANAAELRMLLDDQACHAHATAAESDTDDLKDGADDGSAAQPAVARRNASTVPTPEDRQREIPTKSLVAGTTVTNTAVLKSKRKIIEVVDLCDDAE